MTPINPSWAVVPENTTELWLSLREPDGWYRASVRSDGCLELYRHFNDPDPKTKESDIAQMHICDLDDFIRRLEALRETAKVHFGRDWPV